MAGKLWTAILAATVAGCAFAGSSGPSQTAQPSREQAAIDQGRCKSIGIDGINPLTGERCDQTAAEQRAFESEQTRKTQASIAAAAEQDREQAGADRELRGESLAGDGKYAGAGWYCFEGVQSGVNVGGCHRDLVECGMLLANRKVKGMETDLERCGESASAACIQLTRSLEEGPRILCYPQTDQCERAQDAAEARDDVQELIPCGVHR